MKRHGWFWPALVVGWAFIAVGIAGMASQGGRASPLVVGPFVLGFLLAHDLVLAPAVLVAGWLLGRIVPAVGRGPVRAALALSGLVVLFALPLLGRFGERPTDDSALPLDYGRTVPIVLLVIWLVVLMAVIWRLMRSTVRRKEPDRS
jgi:hypothetical protein